MENPYCSCKRTRVCRTQRGARRRRARASTCTWSVAVGESSAILLHPPLHLAGVSIGTERERQQNDRLASSSRRRPAVGRAGRHGPPGRRSTSWCRRSAGRSSSRCRLRPRSVSSCSRTPVKCGERTAKGQRTAECLTCRCPSSACSPRCWCRRQQRRWAHRPPNCGTRLAIDETVILLTLSLHH